MSSQDSPPGAPYEAVLLRALEKLTSQTFIFLLAYTILLVGLAVADIEMSEGLRGLLYVIPILGVLAHILVRQRRVAQSVAADGVRVRAGLVKDRGYVGGLRGIAGDVLHNVRVATGWVSGEARVVGVDETGAVGGVDHPGDSEARYLLTLYEGLDERDRRRLVAHAVQMRERAESPEEQRDG